MPAQSGDNGKVTIAVVGEMVKGLTDEFHDFRTEMRQAAANREQRIGNLETEQGVLTERVSSIKEDVVVLESWEQGFKLWNGINSLLAGIASAIGIAK